VCREFGSAEIRRIFLKALLFQVLGQAEPSFVHNLQYQYIIYGLLMQGNVEVYHMGVWGSGRALFSQKSASI
jgi:hypothetical protein